MSCDVNFTNLAGFGVIARNCKKKVMLMAVSTFAFPKDVYYAKTVAIGFGARLLVRQV